MKIRTDFVTNSSSSSFMITINVYPKKGEEISTDLEIDCEDEGRVDAKMSIFSKIKKATTPTELLDAIEEDVSISSFILDAAVEEAGMYIEDLRTDLNGLLEAKNDDNSDDDLKECIGFLVNDYEEFREEVLSSISNLSEIDKISITKKHFAYGESIDTTATIFHEFNVTNEIVEDGFLEVSETGTLDLNTGELTYEQDPIDLERTDKD